MNKETVQLNLIKYTDLIMTSARGFITIILKVEAIQIISVTIGSQFLITYIQEE